MSKHNLTRANELYYGDSYFPPLYAANERHGVPFHPVTKLSLGSPAAADDDALIINATSTELPNNSTITYTPLTDNTSPLDGAIAAPTTVAMNDGNSVLVWTLDVPRNIIATSTTAAADTVFTITGYDQYKMKMKEYFTIASAGASAAGKKAFKYVSSIAIYSAGDITTDTVDVGFGDVLGLPYCLMAKSDLNQVWFNEVLETTAATAVIGDTTTATATTGDVRGTIDLNSATDGSAISVYMRLDPSTKETAAGVAQYAG
jgi:hypothetical protein